LKEEIEEDLKVKTQIVGMV